MAERQETSVMVSIQELLRDAQDREAQEKVEAERRAREEEQRRFDEIRRRQDMEQERLRAEEQERQRRAFEEQRRQAELHGLQQATVERARLEAESQARLAEMTSRQEHERQLHALTQDKSKKNLRILLGALAVALLGVALGGGIWIKNAMEEAAVAKRQAQEAEVEKQNMEAERQGLLEKLAAASDPETIKVLQQQIQQQSQKLKDLEQNGNGPKKPVGGGGPAVQATPKPGGGTKAPCNCTPGDPLCSCL